MMLRPAGPRTSLDGAVDDLLLAQDGVASRAQLRDLGIGSANVAAQVEAERWSTPTPTTVLLSGSGLSWRQRLWVAVLSAPSPVALASSTALAVHGMTGLADDPVVHVVVTRSTMVAAIPGVRVHESRRFGIDDVVRRGGLPLCTPERAVVDAVAWQRRPLHAYVMIPAVVQQRLATVARLEEELTTAGQVRHRRHMRLALADVEGGAHALSEIDLRRSCRTSGLAQPSGQVVRREPGGRRRYLDAEWELADGRLIVLEVDGSHHLRVEHWQPDVRRERAIVLSGRTVLRCTASELRLDPTSVMADLREAGVPPA